MPLGGFPSGSRVAVRLDLGRHTVSFGLNGVWQVRCMRIVRVLISLQEAAFTGIQQGTYYPYFFIGQMEKKLTIVDR